MRKRHAPRWPLVVSLAVGAQLSAAPVGTGQQAQPGQSTFRSGITAVPIDVRVIDREGRPVTDLKQEDFNVFEDDIRQPIVHFARRLFVAESPGPGLRARAEVPAFTFTAAPQNHRIFLIVLGAGSLVARGLSAPASTLEGAAPPPEPLVPEPSKALNGLLYLVRDRLLPQDQIAVLAYNRASDFSTDHQAVASVLEAFARSEQAGMAALARVSRPAAVRAPADSAFVPPPPAASAVPENELGFAEYLDARNRRGSDLENLHYGITYLRYMDGEKHLVYVTANGMVQPMPGTLANQTPGVWEDPKKLAATASDARVALHVIQTGGIGAEAGPFLAALPIMWPRILVPGQAYWGSGGSNATASDAGTPRASLPEPGFDRPAATPGVPVPGMSAVGLQALSDLRTIAELTGGHASIMGNASQAIDRIDAQTRAEYVLAYYSSNAASDGRYRSVEVEVNRPGVTVLYRHGYYGRQATDALDRRAVVADGHLIAAASSRRQLRDIRVSVTPTFTQNRKGKGGEVLVQMVIDPSRLVWTTDDLSRRVAHLDVAVFCADAKEKTVGQTRRTLDIALTEAGFGQVTTQGLPYSVRIAVAAPASFLKVVIYNLESNLAGSEVVKLK